MILVESKTSSKAKRASPHRFHHVVHLTGRARGSIHPTRDAAQAQLAKQDLASTRIHAESAKKRCKTHEKPLKLDGKSPLKVKFSADHQVSSRHLSGS